MMLFHPKTSAVLTVVLVLSLCLNGFMYYHLKNKELELHEIKKGLLGMQNNSFDLLSEQISDLTIEEFLEKQKTYTISYTPLREKINATLATTKGDYGFYFEDLTTGAWVGIREKERFIPASLLKVPLFVAILKKIEIGELTLTDPILISKEDVDVRSGKLGLKGSGYRITVQKLIGTLLNDSDNTAANALRRLVSQEDLIEARLGLGLPSPKAGDQQTLVSPKQYSNIFRSLYLSSYLRRTFSQKALILLAHTSFQEQIPAGVPTDIPVAHKVGMLVSEGNYHDCGIVYAPQKPYLLCIMSQHTTPEEAYLVTRHVSKLVFDYVTTT